MNHDSLSTFATNLGSSLKSLSKLLLQSKRSTVSRVDEAESRRPMIIMGNGPSLRDTIDRDHATLEHHPTMAVNFAANAPEFKMLKPRYYLLADPHFFGSDDPNVARLWEAFDRDVDWPMTLFVPSPLASKVRVQNPAIRVERFNAVGVEGFRWLEDAAYGSGRGMPRPRNVLIPAIMTAIRMGYRDIYIVGADHTWMQTLSVNESNQVVSVQPHFYKDNTTEHERVTAVYAGIPLHSVVMSFYVAFRAYHRIADYARRHGIRIYNSTPGSFIDAFERRPLPRQ